MKRLLLPTAVFVGLLALASACFIARCVLSAWGEPAPVNIPTDKSVPEIVGAIGGWLENEHSLDYSIIAMGVGYPMWRFEVLEDAPERRTVRAAGRLNERTLTIVTADDTALAGADTFGADTFGADAPVRIWSPPRWKVHRLARREAEERAANLALLWPEEDARNDTQLFNRNRGGAKPIVSALWRYAVLRGWIDADQPCNALRIDTTSRDHEPSWSFRLELGGCGQPPGLMTHIVLVGWVDLQTLEVDSAWAH